MSSAPNPSLPTLHKFVVYAPDMSDAGALQRRLSVRPVHIERAGGLGEEGFIKLGGALLTPDSIASPTAEKKMVGSLFICEADSLETVKKIMEEDVYYKENVWDKEKLVILPFAPAIIKLSARNDGSVWIRLPERHSDAFMKIMTARDANIHINSCSVDPKWHMQHKMDSTHETSHIPSPLAQHITIPKFCSCNKNRGPSSPAIPTTAHISASTRAFIHVFLAAVQVVPMDFNRDGCRRVLRVSAIRACGYPGNNSDHLGPYVPSLYMKTPRAFMVPQ
ncbi:hypothetical protein A0H81_12986 [Grifola frondosa]|uniref:YCII-related domain-containing protein n=1 Tax=Grifola frondosa TaxID=5627 RepID=A0A1C7LR41_GRIFR|nr:hypothetical protein A0H81_12986 [Grifola frondosa]